MSVMSVTKTVKDVKPVKNMLDMVKRDRTANLEQFSIFLNLKAGVKTLVVLNGAAIREQVFAKGPTSVIDWRVMDEKSQLKIISVPSFSPTIRSMASIMDEHHVVVKTVSEGKPNLKDYHWTEISPMAIEITGIELNGRVYPGQIVEVEE